MSVSLFELSADYSVNNGQVLLTIKRNERSDLYANHIRYAWTALQGDWRTWDPLKGEWQTWDPDSAEWTEVKDQNWVEPNLSMTLRFSVSGHLRRKLLAFRLLPETGCPPVWVYTAAPTKLHYWTVRRRKETLLYLKSEGGQVDTRLLYLQRKHSSDSFRYPLPFQRISNTEAQVCSLAPDFGEPVLFKDNTDPGSLALKLEKQD